MSVPVAPRPSPALARVRAYRPSRHGAPIELRLDGNEGAGPGPELLAELGRAGPETLRRYPDPAALERRLAERLDLEPARVLVTAGADDGLERALRAVLAPGRNLVLPVPTFEMLERYARLAGGEVVPVPWLDGPFPYAAVRSAAGPETAAIAIVTPNNPTGRTVDPADVERLAAELPGALLLLDLAYVEFADADPTARLLALPNVVVFRTFSKAWGLAGLRVGWAAGPAPIVEWLRAAGHPYAVSGPSLRLAEARLDRDGPAVERFVARVREERAALAALLERLGVPSSPSQANFLLVRTPRAAWLHDALAGLGIAVRRFPDRPELADRLRITLPGEPDAFDRLCRALEAALRPQALLLDIDDTLVDVSRSYRRAIRATVESFGGRCDDEAVAELRRAGDANNDWVLSRRLLARQGIERSLAEVTERFERFYQGTGRGDGFREAETLLVTPERLQDWAARLPLGLVTGRPRRDAAAFLARHDLGPLFRAATVMEDGPRKPDPDPVRRVLAALGVRNAWLVGDTPDDVRAARAAGVVPIGVVAPGEEFARTADALTAAGAARVLRDLAELEELLP
jgi:histidinol-phosphate aminotransferase